MRGEEDETSDGALAFIGSTYSVRHSAKQDARCSLACTGEILSRIVEINYAKKATMTDDWPLRTDGFAVSIMHHRCITCNGHIYQQK